MRSSLRPLLSLGFVMLLSSLSLIIGCRLFKGVGDVLGMFVVLVAFGGIDSLLLVSSSSSKVSKGNYNIVLTYLCLLL